MNCPVCQEIQLRISERQGIEIDYCPQCRGVWLDRGELDKLIERSMQPESARPTAQQEFPGLEYSRPQSPPLIQTPPQIQPPQYQQPRHEEPRYEKRRDDDDDDDDDDRRGNKKRKKGGWLGEILDFD